MIRSLKNPAFFFFKWIWEGGTSLACKGLNFRAPWNFFSCQPLTASIASLVGVRKTTIMFSQESATSGYLLLHTSLIMCEPKTQVLRFFLSGLFFNNLRKSVPKDRGAIGKYISFQNPAYILQVTDAVPYNSTSMPAQLFIVSLKYLLCACVYVTRSVMLTLCDPMDCSPPGSSVHGILQARILEWVAMPSSRGSS